MRNKIVTCLLYLVFVSICSCKTQSKTVDNNFSNSEGILFDLKTRGYDIDFNKRNGMETYVSISPTTKINSHDMKLICSLPNLNRIRIQGILIPDTFIKDLENCSLANLKSIRLDEVKFNAKLLCSINADRFFHGGITFLNTSLDDDGLNCLNGIQISENFTLYGSNEKFTEAGLCDFIHSGISIKRVYLFHLSLSEKAFGCLADLQGVEHFGFKKIKGRSANDMKKLEDLYFKKNGRKVHVDVFEYDSP
ncbi:hypothetical protein [Leptospira meyeri]|uniref:hypothetical protein n=1 Tax=Leptospira meyeri TaxID=29508 RepID=UPI000F6377DD|nr:hypothetical protein [Leptospira meyeri]